MGLNTTRAALAPERVDSLVLACTACRHHEWRRELLADWATEVSEHGMAAMSGDALTWLVGPRIQRRFGVLLNVLGRVVLQSAPEPFVAQVEAMKAQSRPSATTCECGRSVVDSCWARPRLSPIVANCAASSTAITAEVGTPRTRWRPVRTSSVDGSCGLTSARIPTTVPRPPPESVKPTQLASQ